MKRFIFTYGSIAGFVIIVTIIIGVEIGHSQVWLGYLVMFITFSTIFVAIRRYRDESLGGVISFLTALLLGLGVSAIAGVVYVAVWELYVLMTDFAIMDSYGNALIEAKRLAGASADELAQITLETEQLREQYANPFYRLPMTFFEVFPVGVLVSLVSAAVLRNHRSAG